MPSIPLRVNTIYTLLSEATPNIIKRDIKTFITFATRYYSSGRVFARVYL